MYKAGLTAPGDMTFMMYRAGKPCDLGATRMYRAGKPLVNLANPLRPERCSGSCMLGLKSPVTVLGRRLVPPPPKTLAYLVANYLI